MTTTHYLITKRHEAIGVAATSVEDAMAQAAAMGIAPIVERVDVALTTLDALPTVVTGPGDYVTRKGQRVTIHTVSDGQETFKAKGSMWRMFRGKLSSQGYAIWHVSGRYDAVTERTRDIVGPWVQAD